jgi:hypothetical protein
MDTYSLAHLADSQLVEQLADLVATDRQMTAALLAYLAEVDARRLYLPAACSSMHAYCVTRLGLAEDAAYKRILAARGPSLSHPLRGNRRRPAAPQRPGDAGAAPDGREHP